MTDTTIPPILLRTTSDGEGMVHGLAIGAGETPDQAVAALKTEAARQAEEYTHPAASAARPPEGHVSIGPDGTAQRAGTKERLADLAREVLAEGRYFEVADVRLTHAPGGGEKTWVAYGTLRSTRHRTEAGGWDGSKIT